MARLPLIINILHKYDHAEDDRARSKVSNITTMHCIRSNNPGSKIDPKNGKNGFIVLKFISVVQVFWLLVSWSTTSLTAERFDPD